jgi:Group 4 capsule polysaccharide lipoprotein gfcB, YjbF
MTTLTHPPGESAAHRYSSLSIAGIVASVVFLLSGCASVPNSSAGSFLHLLVAQHRSQMPSAAAVAAKPYYQMYTSTNAGQAVLILGNVDGKREDWYGHDQVVIFTRHGQVVQTTGFASNLEGMHEAADNPFARGLQHLAAPVTYTRTEDWSGYRYGVPVTARLVPMGITQLKVLDKEHQVLEVDEYIDAPLAHYHAVNHFWVDTHNGLVWKSEQQVAPNQSITMIQLRPYLGVLP